MCYSPVAVQATKRNLIYSMDHTTQEGLDHIVSSSNDVVFAFHITSNGIML